MDSISQLFRRYRHEVVDALFGGGSVEDCPQIRGLVPELVRLRVGGVGLEEHVLVHMSQAFVRSRLSKRSVLYVELDRR